MPYVDNTFVSLGQSAATMQYSWSVNPGPVRDEGRQQGWARANQDYPYMTMRDVQQVTSVATTACNQWIGTLVKEPATYRNENEKRWKAWQDELPDTKRTFINAYIGGYMDRVKQRDAEEEAKKPKPAPQPQPKPVQRPATNPTVQGVSIALLKVDRSGNTFIYTVRIDDPSLQYPIIRELEFDSTKLKPWKSEWGMAAGEI